MPGGRGRLVTASCCRFPRWSDQPLGDYSRGAIQSEPWTGSLVDGSPIDIMMADAWGRVSRVSRWFLHRPQGRRCGTSRSIESVSANANGGYCKLEGRRQRSADPPRKRMVDGPTSQGIRLDRYRYGINADQTSCSYALVAVMYDVYCVICIESASRLNQPKLRCACCCDHVYSVLVGQTIPCMFHIDDR